MMTETKPHHGRIESQESGVTGMVTEQLPRMFSESTCREGSVVDNDLDEQRGSLEAMFKQYLSERERRTLYLYYGLDGGEGRTPAEIGSLLGMTPERIRQIRNRAVEKLLGSPHGKSLSGFWPVN